MVGDHIYDRFAEDALAEALSDAPVILIHGPRQCGKTTLAHIAGARRDYTYFTFDDPAVMASAVSDIGSFVAALPPRVILDEVQRVPDLFTVIKAVVDRDRSPGRFLLTGSANIFLVPRLGDSLAGRMNILRLAPLAQCELAGRRPTFIDQLFGDGFPVAQFRRLDAELIERVVAGGFPAALARKTPARRAAWYRDYVDTLVQRDVRDLARIRSLEAVPKLLAAAALQTAQLFNASELAGGVQLSRPTIGDYLALLERVFLIDRLLPWHSNRLSRLIKTPKLHLVDTGVACALLGLNVAALHANRVALGPLVETFVYQELRRQTTWRDDGMVFSHFRDKDGVEVDMVLERGSSAVAGVEVKAGASVTDADFRGLRKLRSAAGKHFKGGVVLYDGEASMPFGDRLFAVPIRAMWEGVKAKKPRRVAKKR